jgi:ParB/RepB/Spo0J family partition protein
MNAPTRAIELLEAKVELLPLTAIAPSETHIQALRRQRFTKDELKDLADSITKTRGVLQPIVVRPLAAARGLAKYEIVAGERRWLASKLAGFAHIQASVREISDQEVLEVQLIENLQRKGLHELEEAEGYDELMKLKKISAEQLVDMVGKSRSYVYARLKLLALCPEARKAFYAGELDASRALLIARIGHHDTQRQALKDVTDEREPLSYREAHEHILEHYMLKLKSAPFDIKDARCCPRPATASSARSAPATRPTCSATSRVQTSAPTRNASTTSARRTMPALARSSRRKGARSSMAPKRRSSCRTGRTTTTGSAATT